MVGGARHGIQFSLGPPPGRGRAILAGVGLLLSLALGGCATGLAVRQRPAAPVQAWGLAVYPVVFRFQASPYEAFARGRQAAERLASRTGLAVYGPGEFRVVDPDTDDLDRGTTLPSALPYSKRRRPEGMFAVRLVVEERVSSSEAELFDASGRLRGARREERTEVSVAATLLSLATRGAVAEVAGVVRVDPFSDDLDRDPYPDVTRLSTQLVDALVQVAGLPRAAPPPSGLSTIAAPGPALRFAFGFQKSLDDQLSRLDPLDREGRLLGLFQLIDPDASSARLKLFEHAPYGLVVTAVAGAAARAGLRVDDLILTAGGERLTGRYALDRHLAAGPTRLTVERRGLERQVELTASR